MVLAGGVHLSKAAVELHLAVVVVPSTLALKDCCERRVRMS